MDFITVELPDRFEPGLSREELWAQKSFRCAWCFKKEHQEYKKKKPPKRAKWGEFRSFEIRSGDLWKHFAACALSRDLGEIETPHNHRFTNQVTILACDSCRLKCTRAFTDRVSKRIIEFNSLTSPYFAYIEGDNSMLESSNDGTAPSINVEDEDIESPVEESQIVDDDIFVGIPTDELIEEPEEDVDEDDEEYRPPSARSSDSEDDLVPVRWISEDDRKRLLLRFKVSQQTDACVICDNINAEHITLELGTYSMR